MHKSQYAIPAEPLEWQQEIKKSRFIVNIGHTPRVDDAKLFIRHIKHRYPAANHHCSAFVAGHPHDSQCLGFSDDGEPPGTAGKPMLAVLQGRELGEICVVVSRIFGGIKLGTGGLVKAYAGSVVASLLELSVKQYVVKEDWIIHCNYESINWLEQELKLVEVETVQRQFLDQVCFHVRIPKNQVCALTQRLRSKGKGQIFLEQVK